MTLISSYFVPFSKLCLKKVKREHQSIFRLLQVIMKDPFIMHNRKPVRMNFFKPCSILGNIYRLWLPVLCFLFVAVLPIISVVVCLLITSANTIDLQIEVSILWTIMLFSIVLLVFLKDMVISGGATMSRSEDLKPSNTGEIVQQMDRLSYLHDGTIFHIFSYVSTRDFVRTSLLSKRWKYLWTQIPNLEFDDHTFPFADRKCICTFYEQISLLFIMNEGYKCTASFIQISKNAKDI